MTIDVTSITMVDMAEPRATHSIKIKLSILHKGKIAAITRRKTLGQWLEEAVLEKLEREQKPDKND